MKQHIPQTGPSQRQLRVGETVRHALADVLSRNEANIQGLESHIITVPEVRMTPDLRHAMVFIVPLGAQNKAASLKLLKDHAKPLRGALSRRLRALKFSPELRFSLDQRFDEAARIDAIFDKIHVRQDTGKPAVKIIDDTEDLEDFEAPTAPLNNNKNTGNNNV